MESVDPLETLARWAGELPVVMTLATADASGAPHARTVLATVIDGDGVRFHSSTPTTKTRDIDANPRVSAVFLWPDAGRQVVLHGTARELDPAVSREAFPTRPRPLQLLAWAYEELTPDVAVEPGAVHRAYDAAADRAEMPPSWTTVQITPERLDFWRAGTPPSRTRFVRSAGGWESYEVLP